ncbi:SMP-30/gluconolactonase/LRE family protein [Paenalcaligenes niemegkensis]|uniref:SMP-30/gluconolactonase/LRE family protein n=1 Tax=Paenalcaligenes niemegkensis TaxID=2895469 RepID=UPI001EE9557E|nr:SMP-30/gluconolactonase/LRE family protein [Paenalcaligenes niemegkensis]MCQ9618107.1 SMP-30/gluconolactonase/LRE family protein [Paenalcaligenes niemegkensis]
MWQVSERYPDPRIQSLHADFAHYRLASAAVEMLASGTRWAEGPVWFGDGRFLLWSDIPRDRIMKWEESTGSVSVFRQGSNMANGNTRDRFGRLISCEHLSRRVTRTEYDGSITVLADSFEGKPLNSPNDVIVKSDNSVWFTDPPFGIRDFYEGRPAKQELPANVYRIDGQSGEITVVASDVEGPNGLCFSPDETILYIVASRAQPNRLIYAYDVAPSGKTITNQSILIDCGPGTSDGIRCDEDGNLWCGWGMGSEELDGVRVFSKQGTPLGHIHLPERCANLCFGGKNNNQLFMAAGKSLFSLYVNVRGAL